MILQIIRISLLGLLICGLLPFSALARDQAQLKDMFVTDSESALLLYFRVTNAFSAEMEEGIKNGIPVSFTFYIELLQAKNGWPDKDIVSRVFDHTLTYDNLKEEYLVSFGETKKIIAVSSLAEAEKLMVEIHDYKLAELIDLMPAVSYKARLKVRLAKKTLPLNFQYVIPFWNLWEFETDWYELDFMLKPANQPAKPVKPTNQQNQQNQ
jgi:hypothetical protein